MVSFLRLLRRASLLVQEPQPFLTELHASFLLKSVAACPISKRSPADTKAMLNMVIQCPHVATVFANNAGILRRTVSAFLLDEKIQEDMEAELVLRQIIRKAAANNDLPVALMISMVSRLNSVKTWSCGKKGCKVSPIEDKLTTGELLKLIIDRLPRDRIISTEEGNNWSTFPKHLHKKKSMRIERGELYYLVSVLQNVSVVFRNYLSVNCDNSGKKAPVVAQIPETIAIPVIQCLTSLPPFSDKDVPLNFDDWVCLMFLIGSCDTRIHEFGKEVWFRKSHMLNLNASDMNRHVIFSIMLKSLGSLRDSMKLDVMEMWLDVLSAPELIATASSPQLRIFLYELSFYYKSRSTTDTVRKVLLTARQLFGALDSASANEKDRINALECRLEYSVHFPFLKTSEELKKSFSRINEMLLTSDNKLEALRSVADFLRSALKVLGASVHDVVTTACNMVEATRQLLATLPQFDQPARLSLGSVSITCNLLIRAQDVNEKSVEDSNDWATLSQKLRTFVDEFLQHPTASQCSYGATSVLQLMDLLGLASEAQYTIPVREVVLGVLRQVAGEAEDISPYLAQRCFDVVLRSMQFHVADAEVLSVASDAVKRATSMSNLRSMTWDHRQLMLERSTVLYSELVPLFSTRREARRLAKQIISIAGAVAADRADGPRQALSQREVRARRRCAGLLWTLAVRAAVAPVPRALIDRHLTAMLSFTRRHWVSHRIQSGGTVCEVDEELSRELLEGMIPSLRRFFVLAFKQRAAFFANLRRNKLVISTACEVIWFNRTVLSPCLWYSVQAALTNLPLLIPGQCTPRQLEVLRMAMEHTIRNAQACGNRGTWHLRRAEATKMDKTNDDNDVILGPRDLGYIFACAELILDAPLREYLITLVVEQIALVGDELEVSNEEKNDSLTNEEVIRVQYFKKCRVLPNGMNLLERRVIEEVSKDIIVMPKPPSVCLLLLSGLPGSGKSELSRALRQQLCPSDAIEIVSVIELDAFIQSPGDGSFSPEAWRVACVATREATMRELRNWSSHSGATMRFVLLIDTFPYRSMRTVYWKICRDICRERLGDPTGAVGMLEVRLNVPLVTCLHRNENRVGTGAYIPPYVVKSMAAVFDGKLLTSVQILKGNSWSLSSGQSASTWPVLALCSSSENCDCFNRSAIVLARQLLDCLLSGEVVGELCEQVRNVASRESKRRERAEQQQQRSSILHELDIHMRALVRNYMTDRQAAGTMNLTIGPQVSAWREEHYSSARRAVQLQGALGDDEAADASVQKAIKEFEHKLALSWDS